MYATLDPESGTELPANTEGELASRGPTTMLGYWDKPLETADTLWNGWVRSGDPGRVREDGHLEVTGRSKDLCKSGGELVMPGEIEDLVSAHPSVSQAFVFGLSDDRWGEAGCLCVARADGRTPPLGAEEVIALCKAKPARFKVPEHVLFLRADELPTTATGKVQKYRLAEWAREVLAAPPESATDNVEASP